ncbi:VOC family protein [Noviherbaspirillum saxi]|uniref:VOC family protein n=1 Tax=Noviherbaspirillum saxi TaxID=2320863 RepID=A0A3A3G4H7_9BURK|nr:VOC family protein [Noviherbaspirillum saxi]RJF96326.1 VOC family protein [Noviherbaspirillum saxi]
MSNNPLNFLARSFDQICFVVEDLDEAVEFWRKTNGIDAWNIAENLAKEQTEKEYRGKPGDFQFSCAYGFAGDTLIELARHDGGSSVYKDWLDTNGKGPHHVGFRLANAEEYAQAEHHYLDCGIEKSMAGFFQGPFGNCRWSYFDTRETIGCYTELYYVDGELVERLMRLKSGEVVSITS